jgi:FkbM family methyltransferase
MNMRLKTMAKPLLQYLPAGVLNRVIRRRPYLAESLPVGFQLKWPYYLGDVTVLVDVSNAIENQMIAGEYDWEVSRTIRHYVKPGDFCIDVGANSGPLTLLLAKLTGGGGRVLSFEPGPPYFERLKRNLDLNPGFGEIVTPIQEGLSDREGTLLWAADPEHLYNAGFLNVTEGTKVPVSTLDASVKRHGWNRLDFVKIDVEGMELEVLQGARETLERFRPIVLFETIELFREARGFDIFGEIEGMLNSLDYGLYYLTPSNILIEVQANRLPANTLALPLKRNNP